MTQTAQEALQLERAARRLQALDTLGATLAKLEASAGALGVKGDNK